MDIWLLIYWQFFSNELESREQANCTVETQCYRCDEGIFYSLVQLQSAMFGSDTACHVAIIVDGHITCLRDP